MTNKDKQPTPSIGGGLQGSLTAAQEVIANRDKQSDGGRIPRTTASHMASVSSSRTVVDPDNMEDRPIDVGISNIVPRKKAKALIGASLDAIADTVSATMGPYGSTTIIQDNMNRHYYTKDGYTVLKALTFSGDVQRTVLDHVKTISRKLVHTVGDGSTSAVVVAAELYKSLSMVSDRIGGGITPKGVTDALGELSHILSDCIRQIATPVSKHISPNIVTKVAVVSTNNDQMAGELIGRLFDEIGEHGSVLVEEGTGVNDEYTLTRGYELLRGYVDHMFVNKDNGIECELMGAYVLMCDDNLTEKDIVYLHHGIVTPMFTAGKPLVFIARGYDKSFREYFRANKLRQRDLPILAVDMATITKDAKDRFEDLAAYLGAVPYRKSEGVDLTDMGFSEQHLGLASRVVSSEGTTRFFEGKSDTAAVAARVTSYEKRITDATSRNDHIDRDGEVEAMRRRIAALQAKAATLWVGGSTEQERTARQFLIEDAVYAVKSAMRHGVIAGGCITVPTILEQSREYVLTDLMHRLRTSNAVPALDNEERLGVFCGMIIDCVRNAFLRSYERVLTNSGMEEHRASVIAMSCSQLNQVYDVRTGQVEDQSVTSIVNSAETDTEIVKAAFSIVGLLLTSNQFISTSPQR
jgi:chaperonin GroEL